jgi:hypothetical protein
MNAPLDPTISEAIDRGRTCDAALAECVVRMELDLELAFGVAGGGVLGFQAALAANARALRSFAVWLQRHGVEAEIGADQDAAGWAA